MRLAVGVGLGLTVAAYIGLWWGLFTADRRKRRR